MIEQIITSSILIVAVLILTGLLERSVNPCVKYALWLLVAVKLLVPLPEFESNFSVMNAVNLLAEADWPEKSAETDAEYTPENVPQNVVGIEVNSAANNVANNEANSAADYDVDRAPDYRAAVNHTVSSELQVQDGRENSDAEPMQNMLLPIVWVVGMIECAGVFFWSNLRFGREVKRNRKCIGCYKNKLKVYQVSGIGSPCLFGLYQPGIYFQEGYILSEEQREYVCAHEYTHYRHGDHIWAIVRCVCVIVYWFNPLVWVAARASMKDGELACDAGTLKLIGAQHNLDYGRTLVALAKNKSTYTWGMGVLECSTGATGGAKEMKKRIRMITTQPVTKTFSLLILLIACVGLVGCTFSEAVGEEKVSSDAILSEEAANNALVEAEEKALKEALEQENAEMEAVQEEIKKQEAELIKEAALAESQELAYKNAILYKTPIYDENKVCIRVQPSALGVREQLSYYYVPDHEDMEWIMGRVKALNLQGQPYAKRWKGMKETGWQLIYNGWQFMVFEGGYLYSLYDNGTMECLVEDPKLCDYIQIMLQENLDYHAFDPADIQNIASARLDVCSVLTNWEFRSQTITDEEQLEALEELLSEAEYIYGGAECGNNVGYLELTLADGEVVCLSLATDSCDNFGINGVYYDYHPVPGGDNSLFYQYFDELTTESTGELKKHISNSLVYSGEEIEAAVGAVEAAFAAQFADCTLKEITYYESFSNQYAAQWETEYGSDQAIVLTSDIEVPAANTNEYWSLGGTYYNLEWILTRDEGEEWVVQTWRY